MKRPIDERSHKDPVCGMVVSRLTAVAEAEFQSKTYYFCAPDVAMPSLPTRSNICACTGSTA